MRSQCVVRRGTGAVAMLVLAACSGSGDDNSVQEAPDNTYTGCPSPASCGDVTIAVSHASAEFVSYEVDVRSLTLKQMDGASAKTVPATTRIDLATAADQNQSLTFASVPNGAYVEGTLELDYTNADILVEANGQQLAARVVGADGNPAGLIHVPVILGDHGQLTVAPGSASLLTVDFDLAAASAVDLTAMTPIVTVMPSLTAMVSD